MLVISRDGLPGETVRLLCAYFHPLLGVRIPSKCRDTYPGYWMRAEPEFSIRADVVWYYGVSMGSGVRSLLSSSRAGSHVGSGTTALLIAIAAVQGCFCVTESVHGINLVESKLDASFNRQSSRWG